MVGACQLDLECGGACVDPLLDPNHCGDCEHSCSGQAPYCSHGACTSEGSLVRWYPFDGNTQDASPAGVDATAHGATPTSDRFGNVNAAYYFNGETDYVVAPGIGLPFGNDPRTFSAWIRPDDNPVSENVSVGGFIVTGSGDCTSQMFGAGRYVHTTGMSEAYFWSGCDDYASSLPLPVQEWAFVAIRWDGASAAVFVNDSVSVSNGVGTLGTVPSQLWVGIEPLDDNLASVRYYFQDAIDDLRVYARALSDAEVFAMAAEP